MDSELQVAFVAAGFGVLGTLLGGMLQYFTAERSARLRRLEDHKTRLREEKREGSARFLAAVLDLYSKIQYADTRIGDYGDEVSLSELADDVFQDLRTKLFRANDQVSRSYVEVMLIASRGEIQEALGKVRDRSDEINKILISDRKLKDFGDWAGQLGEEYANLVIVLRKDLSIE